MFLLSGKVSAFFSARVVRFIFMLLIGVIMLISSGSVAFSQASIPVYIWEKVFSTGFSGDCRGVTFDHDGNIIITGYTRGRLDLGDGTFLDYTGGREIFLVKLAPSGTPIWAQTFGSVFDPGVYGPPDDEGAAVAVDSSNNILMVGYFLGEIDFGDGPLTGSFQDKEDIFVAKFAPDGTLLWSREFLLGEAIGVTVDSDDNVIITGTSDSGTASFGGPLEGGFGYKHIFVAKLSGYDGNPIWARATGGFSNKNYGSDVAVTSNNDVVVTGTFEAPCADFGPAPTCGGIWPPDPPGSEGPTCLIATTHESFPDGTEIFVARLASADGTHVWSKSFGSHDYDSGKGVAIDGDDNIFLTGGFRRTVNFGGADLTSNGQPSDIYVVKLDSDGNHIWSKGFGTPNGDGGADVAVDSNGDVFATGTFRGTLDFGGGAVSSAFNFSDPTDPSTDIFALKLDGTNGAYVWAAVLGDGRGERVGEVAVDHNDYAVFTGIFEGTVDFGGGPVTSPGFSFDFNFGPEAIFVAKYGEPDITPPVLVLPEDLIVEATGPSGALVNYTVTATDNFDPDPTVVCTPLSGSMFSLGTTTVTCTATDATGNSSSNTFDVTVQDTTPPVLGIPVDVTLEAIGILSMYTSSDFGIAIADDLVDGAVDVIDDIPAAGFPLGETVVTYTASDSRDNTATATQLVTIVDTTPPKLTVPPDITVEATGSEMILDIGMATATDIFEPVEVSNDAPPTFPVGETAVMWTAMDANGNTASAEQLVTILDTTPPDLVAPPDITVEANGNPNSSVELGTASAMDLVDGEIEAINDAPAGGFPLGAAVVTWTATDASGNTATATQQVTVVDTTPPSLTVPADVSVIAAGSQTAVDIGTATAEDLFGPVNISNDAPGTFPVGETVVIWTASDVNGNVATATQRVLVQYLFGGFLPPVSQGGVYKQGRTIPVKIRALYEDGSLVTGLAPTLSMQLLVGGELSGEPLDVQSNSAADTGNTFRLADDHYILNLDTRPFSQGMYRMMVDLQDGAGPVHFIDIVLK